jgi:hypothetical protein
VVPVHYNLHLNPNNETFSFSGQVDISYAPLS